MSQGPVVPLDAVGTDPVDRRAARVLLLDAADRILLFRGTDPAAPERGTWWHTPGGGLDPGESFADGAARELREETGLDLPAQALGTAVHQRVAEFVFGGTAYRQSEQFFLVRVEAHDVDTAGFTPLELTCLLEHRWWSRSELERTDDAVYPANLRAVLGRVAGGSWC